MIKKELIERSPIRILEKSTHGGLQKGDIGVIAARKGVGKTACLVHIATDQLLQDKHVIHISFSENPQHIITWYEDIYKEIATRNNLDNAQQVHDEFIRNRIIMSFNQDGIHITEIEKSIKQLIEAGNFSADLLIIDGYDFAISSKEELQEFKTFASELNLTLWFSASVPGDAGSFNGSEIPELLQSLTPEIALVICMQPKGDHIHLNLLKDHDNEAVGDLHLKLDPQVLLIAKEE